MPVSSCTSRRAACSKVSPSSSLPLGKVQSPRDSQMHATSTRPRRFSNEDAPGRANQVAGASPGTINSPVMRCTPPTVDDAKPLPRFYPKNKVRVATFVEWWQCQAYPFHSGGACVLLRLGGCSAAYPTESPAAAPSSPFPRCWPWAFLPCRRTCRPPWASCRSFVGGVRGFRHEVARRRSLVRSLAPSCVATRGRLRLSPAGVADDVRKRWCPGSSVRRPCSSHSPHGSRPGWLTLTTPIARGVGRSSRESSWYRCTEAISERVSASCCSP